MPTKQDAAPAATPKNELWASYQTDKTLENDGVWVTDFPGGGKVKVRRPSSPPSQEALRRAQQKHRAAITRAQRKREDLPPEVAKEINLQWFANGVIIDWEGITDRAGKPLAFSPENALWLFGELPDFLVDIIAAATSPTLFRPEGEDLGDDAKN